MLDRLAYMRMLDIGVGRGRTTAHFGSLVKEYTGIDYSPRMIEACRQQFRYAKVPFRFEVGDARDLHVFGDGVFDFILFSFNGLDAMTDRKSTRLNSSHSQISYAVFCLKKKNFFS